MVYTIKSVCPGFNLSTLSLTIQIYIYDIQMINLICKNDFTLYKISQWFIAKYM